jgi:FkbM family methyltransferase
MDKSLKETLRLTENYTAQLFWKDQNSRIFIYGIGKAGQDIYRTLSQKGIAAYGFMDHRTHNMPSINNIRVYQPNDETLTTAVRKEATVILAIHNREVHMPAIIENLRKLNYTRFVTMIDLYDHFSQELGIRYWLTKRGYYCEFENEIDIAYNLFADETSQAVYSATLQFRTTGDFALLPTPDIEHQYFPFDLPAWKSPLRLIDCGAYDGDAIRDFIKSGYEIESLAAFEPDITNFKKLSSFTKENLEGIQELVLFPCGAYSQTSQLHFSSGQGEASSLALTGDSTIQCIALDEALPNFAPTLIKMDIEGAELEALLGSKELITTYKPGLAISAYHTPEHLWQIPILINEMSKGNYTFHLRAHAYNCFDTVLYAIPIN